jgi:hypothetical protein
MMFPASKELARTRMKGDPDKNPLSNSRGEILLKIPSTSASAGFPKCPRGRSTLVPLEVSMACKGIPRIIETHSLAVPPSLDVVAVLTKQERRVISHDDGHRI